MLRDITNTLKFLYVSIIVYNLGLFIVKDSILYQYLRFFIRKSYRRATWSLIVFITSLGLILIVTSCLSCVPVRFYWDKSIKGGKCISMGPFWLSSASLNILTDLAVWLLPMPVLKILRLPKKQKLSLIAVFALGGLYVEFQIYSPKYILTRIQWLYHQYSPTQRDLYRGRIYRYYL